VDEITITGNLIDPDVQKNEQKLTRGEWGDFLSQEEEVFLLSLQAQDVNLEENYGMHISVGYFSNWFIMYWHNYEGTFARRLVWYPMTNLNWKTLPGSSSTGIGLMFSLITWGTFFGWNY
jgi:hypothetical protein